MQILQTNIFKKRVKRLHFFEKKCLDKAVQTIIKEPFSGTQKSSDLSNLRVYKFKIKHQLMLLGYVFNAKAKKITLISLGGHENFYRDIKRNYN